MNVPNIKGLKIKQENLEYPKVDTLPETGPALRRVVVDGRSPVVNRIAVDTIRTDHDRKEKTSKSGGSVGSTPNLI